MKLCDLLKENEIICTYHLTCESFITRQCIMRKDNDDIYNALEDTLHRILEAGGTAEDVYAIMGAEIPTEEEWFELEEYDEYIPIDLGYVLPGLIDSFEKEK